MDKEWINRGYIGDKGCENMKKKLGPKGLLIIAWWTFQVPSASLLGDF